MRKKPFTRSSGIRDEKVIGQIGCLVVGEQRGADQISSPPVGPFGKRTWFAASERGDTWCASGPRSELRHTVMLNWTFCQSQSGEERSLECHSSLFSQWGYVTSRLDTSDTFAATYACLVKVWSWKTLLPRLGLLSFVFHVFNWFWFLTSLKSTCRLFCSFGASWLK